MKSLSGSIMFLIGLMISLAGMAQNPAKHIREGNEHFEEKDYAKAETSYLKALETDTGYVAGQFNRADALYEQENYQQAAKIFNSLTERNLSENDQAAVWHNLGNSLVKGDQFGPAAEAYKNALRRNPSDMDTKYNLTYALEKLKDKQKKNQDQKNQDKNQDKKQDKEQQDKDKNKEDQQNKDKKDQDQDKKKKDQDKQNQPQDQNKKKEEQQKQPQPRKISKNEARRMLEALKNNEKQTLKKLKRIKAKGQEVDVEKDW